MKKTTKLTGYPSIDQPWLNYYPPQADLIDIPRMTSWEMTEEVNKGRENETALLYFGKKISHKDNAFNVERVAASLKNMGYTNGFTMPVLSVPTPESSYLLQGIGKIGSASNMLSPSFTPEQMYKHIKESDSDTLFLLDNEILYGPYLEPIQDSKLKEIITFSPQESFLLGKKGKKILDNAVTWKDFIQRGKGYRGKTHYPYHPNTHYSTVYSSGTTGDSKGIALPHEAYTTMPLMYKATGMNFTESMKFLHTIPFNHSTGQNNSFEMVLKLKGIVILDPPFSATRFANSIIKYRPDVTIAPVTHFLPLIDDPKMKTAKGKKAISNMKFPYWVGEYGPDYYRSKLNDLWQSTGKGIFMEDSSGECELGPAITTTIGQWNNYDKPSAGKPLPGVIIGCFDPITGEEKKYNQKGMVWASTPARMIGYYKNPDKTLSAFGKKVGNRIESITASEFEQLSNSLDRGKLWVCLGDFGHIDEQGNLFYHGRSYDAVNLDSIVGTKKKMNTVSNNKIDLFDMKKEIIGDSTKVIDCEVVDVEYNNKKVLACHLILHPFYNSSVENLILEIDNKCSEKFGQGVIPVGYKIKSSFAQAISGKRDKEVLRGERAGFLKPIDGTICSVSIPRVGEIEVEPYSGENLEQEVNNYQKNLKIR